MNPAPATAPPSPPRTRRDPALDLLRTIALGRVLLWHAFAAPWMTFFAAMPVMFFVAGTLLAPAAAGRSHRAVVRRRTRRLLLPLWVYAAVVAGAGLFRDPPGWATVTSAPAALGRAATWVVPLVDPASADWHGGWLSTHLWYLRAYLWVLLLAPVLAILARRVVRTLPVLFLAVAAVEVSARTGGPIFGSGSVAVLVGDVVTYGPFVVMGMAYRTKPARLPAPVLAVGAAAAAAATALFVATAGLPAGGVNESYGAVALTGLACLLAIGAAEGPIRRVAERRHVRRLTEAVSQRAVTIYLWHPAAIALAYSILNGSDVFPRMTAVHRWPVPAVFVVAFTAASTALAVGAVGWVEDLAARRSPGRAGRRRSAGRRAGGRAVRLAAMVPSAAAVLALMIPSLVVPVAEGVPAGATVFSAPRPPSFRAALANDAFARRTPVDDRAPIGRVDPARAPVTAALRRWLASEPGLESVAVGVAVHGRIWTGSVHRTAASFGLDPDEEFGAASMTKTFTTALLLREVQAGRVRLEQPVPPLRGLRVTGDAARITVGQLLEHSSGLIDYGSAPGFDPSRPLDPREAVQLALSSGLRNAPGTEVHYSNTNFQYLGLLLEELTGRSFSELVAALSDSHGLQATRLGPSGPGWPGFSSGGVTSTLRDLAQWGDWLFTPDRVLPAEQVRRLTTLGDNNMALSMWPLCPCGTTPAGEKQYSAIGQTVGYGGLIRFPSGMTLVVRFHPAPLPRPLDPALVSLGHELQRALRVASPGRNVTSGPEGR